MTFSRSLAGAAALGLALLTTTAVATPALADDPPPPIKIDTPADTQGTANVTVSGTVDDLAPVGAKLSVVVLRNGQGVARCDDDFDFSDPNKVHPCGLHPVPDQLGRFAFSFPTQLAYNGPYTVTANETNLLSPQPATSDFKVAAPPARPADVKTTTNPDGSVTVSWTPNTEPDLVGYDVTRTNLDGSKVGLGGPADAAHPSVTDHDAAKTGGLLRYTVNAKRPNGDGDPSKPLTAQTTTSLTLPVPGGAGTSATLLPGFGTSKGGAGTVKPGASTTVPEPDNGFSSSLPFSAKTSGAGKGSADGLATAGHAEASNDGRALVVPLAGGIFLCVAAFHLGWLNRRFLRPEEPLYLPMEDPVVEEPPASRQLVSVGQGRSTVSAPYDHATEIETWGRDADR